MVEAFRRIFQPSSEIQLPVLHKEDIPTGGKIVLTVDEETRVVRVAFIVNERNNRIGVIEPDEAATILVDTVYLLDNLIMIECPTDFFWHEYQRILKGNRKE